MFNGIWRDLKLAVRSLTKARAFTFVVVISLGIGMTPVIAVPYYASIFDEPPTGLDTSRLVELVTTPQGPRQASTLWSYPDFITLEEASRDVSLTGWATADTEMALPLSLGGRTTARTMFVSANYFETFGITLAQGPGFTASPDPVLVLSHDFWQRKLGADPAIIGRPLVVNRVAHVVVGVVPEGFQGHLGFHEIEVFAPLERHPTVLTDTTVRFDRGRDWVNVHGRLAEGATLEQASAGIAAVTAQLAKDHQKTNEFKSGVLAPYHAIGALQSDQLGVLRAVGQALTVLPLLVVCLNIAGMVQARSAMRERELSIRQAIGATRGRLVQQLLAESVVLAAVGAALASLVLFSMPAAISWWTEQPIGARLESALAVDSRMVAICAGLCLGSSLVFGWLPAARFSRPVIITVLKDEAGGGGVRVGRVHRIATAIQVAIATPLLILSTMTLDRVRATATNDLGFASETLYAASFPFHAVEPGTATARVQGASAALARASGIASVTVADGLPLDFRYRTTRVATQPADQSAPKVVFAHVTRVGDGYLDTLGVPLLRGRAFAPEDGPGAEYVTLVSQPLAARLFPGEDAVGKRLSFSAGEKTERTLTIVGVTGDFPTSQMSTDRAQLLLPLAQYPNVREDSVDVNDDLGGGVALMLVARSQPGESALKITAALETVIREVDPEFPPGSVRTGVELRRDSVRDFLTQASVAGTVGGVLLLLAALGIYGVVGLMVATRVREIAVRVALGASRGHVVRMVLFDVVKLVAPGIFIGLLLAIAFVRLNGQDFGIALSGLEPLAYVIGSAVAAGIAIVSSLAPARRAASVHPMVAMRSE